MPIDLHAWIAAGGQRLTYHIGNLMADRQSNPALDDLAAVVWDLYETGAISLRQRRHYRGTEYILVAGGAPVRWKGCYRTSGA